MSAINSRVYKVHQLLLVFILNEEITILSTRNGFEINEEKNVL